MRLSRREIFLAWAGYIAAAVVATYPLILRPFDALPGGLADPALNTTILAWDADRILHGFRGFWNAPFLFPNHHALAYSEHLLGIAVFTAPLQWITGNPIFVYNVAFIASYAFAGFGMYLLARALWGRADAAALAGLAFALSPYRLVQSTHLQVLMSGWMPLGLWALHRYFETGSKRALWIFTVAFALQGLSNGYFLYFFCVPVILLTLTELIVPRLPRVRLLKDLSMAVIFLALVFVPIAWAYREVQRDSGLVRSIGELIQASPSDYARVSVAGWNWGGWLAVGEGEHALFQGLVVMALAAAGVLTAFRTNRPAWARHVCAYFLITLCAVWLSFGAGPWRPYAALYAIVPGLNGLRVVARLAAIAGLGLAALGGAGAAAIFDALPRRVALAAAIVLATIIVVEGQHGATSVDPFPPLEARVDRDVYDWLRVSPSGGVLELNIAQQDNFRPYTLSYQFAAVGHGHPIVNGYSGWKSGLQEFLGGGASPLREPGQTDAVLRALRTTGVRYVLLHRWTYQDSSEPDRIASEVRASTDQIAEERQFAETLAWRLKDSPAGSADDGARYRWIDPRSFTARASHQQGRVPLAVDGDPETRWLNGQRQTGTEWIDIALNRPTDVGRIRIETAPRGMGDYPRHLVIESIDESGVSHVLFDGSVLQRLVEAVATNRQGAAVDLDLPSNRSTRVRLRQTGQTRVWFWSVHGLSVWER